MNIPALAAASRGDIDNALVASTPGGIDTTPIRERPILFSSPMVRAILAGTKSQTRRVVKPQPPLFDRATRHHQRLLVPYCPYGQPGDRLWVREGWRASSAHDSLPPRDIPKGDVIEYGADQERVLTGKLRPSMFMPRWASRILLEVIGARVERLNDISEADAWEEGITSKIVIVGTEYAAGSHREITDGRFFYEGCQDEGFESEVDAYASLWEQINGPGSWATNPFVWVVSFKRVTP